METYGLAPLDERDAERSGSPPGRGWNPGALVALRFAFLYWLIFAAPQIIDFPSDLFQLATQQAFPSEQSAPAWVKNTAERLGFPAKQLREGMNWLVPRTCRALLRIEIEPPTDPSGSGDRKIHYCEAFTNLVLALFLLVVWTLASEIGRRRLRLGPANGDRLQAWLSLIVRFILMTLMLGYGSAKIWCSQFPPIRDGQLDVTYGDSSPMGLLWRFMQYSQPYTIATGLIEFGCGLLLISRRTSLLGALCSAGASLQIFLLNMCFDVPVKLLSGHMLLMAATLIVPQVPRLCRFFILGKPAPAPQLVPLFGGGRIDRFLVAFRTVAFTALAVLQLLSAYQMARRVGILAPASPASGNWSPVEIVRGGKSVPLQKQSGKGPSTAGEFHKMMRAMKPSPWKGGAAMPAVTSVYIDGPFVMFRFGDETRGSYRSRGIDPSVFMLAATDGHEAGELRTSFPDADQMILEGKFEGEETRLVLRKDALATKEYPLKTREFNWIQEYPFNR